MFLSSILFLNKSQNELKFFEAAISHEYMLEVYIFAKKKLLGNYNYDVGQNLLFNYCNLLILAFDL